MAASTVAVGTLASAALAAPSPEIDRWILDRASEYRAAMRGTTSPEPQVPDPGSPLWHQRPQKNVLADFVPPSTWAPLIRDVSPGVVNISTVSLDATPAGSESERRSVGSGFLISSDGFVVTNSHVVERAKEIVVKLSDGREYRARTVGRDPSTDVALMQLEGVGATPLPFGYLGDSDKLEVGDWVVAIGNPFGLVHSVAHGMISAKERVIGVGVFDDFIQTDTPINPGNSGGPLFNMRGEVVGVNTAIVSQGHGIGFAVPINMVKELLPNLRRNGRLERGWLGVNIQEPTSGMAVKGAVVKEVYRNSPAAKAGIHPGDRVLSVNGRPIDSYLQLLRRVSILAPGSAVKMTLHRTGIERDVVVELSQRPAPETLRVLQSGASGAGFGLLVSDVGQGRMGVVGVLPGTPAERAGVMAGDIILEVNKRPVTTLRQYEDALKAANAQLANGVLLRLSRQDKTLNVKVSE